MDIHCHCLPGLDDGPQTLTDALELCRALVNDGISTVIACPHQLGRCDGRNSPAIVREAVTDLNNALATENIPLAVLPGGDVRLDERIASLCDTDGILTVADSRQYLMLEFPDGVFMDITRLVNDLRSRGLQIIISHPERNGALIRQPHAVARLIDSGALLQLTAASITGDFGPVAERAAWHWLMFGSAVLVATDAHDTNGRRPRMSDAMTLIAAKLGHDAARRVCIDNPRRVLTGRPRLTATEGAHE